MSNIHGVSRSRTVDPHDEEQLPAPPPAPFRREHTIRPAADARYDALLRELVLTTRGAAGAAGASSVSPPASKEAPLEPTNDQILYVGVNPDSVGTESDGLRKLRPDTKVVIGSAGDVITHGGRSFDLSSADGRKDFVASLGLRGKTADDVAGVLASCSAGGRATLAEIAKVWSAAERGEAIPSRLLLSGHSTGQYVSGGGNKLAFADVHALAKAMPKAARQIEDVHISGCFSSGNARDNAAWMASFPNMKTLWAYDGFAPTSPVHHFGAWEASTRGRQDKLAPSPWLRDQNVACWSAKRGYVDRNASPEALERSKRSADAAFDRLMAGSPRITTPMSEPAVSHYRTYRSLANRSERADRQEMTKRADQLLALRNYETTVRGKFATTYAAQIERGFRALGLTPPRFETLTRAEALDESRKLREAIARTSPVPEAARELETILRGLDTFDPHIVKPEWSTHAE